MLKLFILMSLAVIMLPGVALAGEPVTVPEPATMILLGSGLLGLWGARKKFKK